MAKNFRQEGTTCYFTGHSTSKISEIMIEKIAPNETNPYSTRLLLKFNEKNLSEAEKGNILKIMNGESAFIGKFTGPHVTEVTYEYLPSKETDGLLFKHLTPYLVIDKAAQTRLRIEILNHFEKINNPALQSINQQNSEPAKIQEKEIFYKKDLSSHTLRLVDTMNQNLLREEKDKQQKSNGCGAAARREWRPK
jgi:hypothetical protein